LTDGRKNKCEPGILSGDNQFIYILNTTRTILYKSFVQTFYKQNAGLFAFLVFIMIASVGRANGVGLLEYHFTLIRAMLTDNKFLAFVLIAWLLYALKCEQFMADKLQGKNYSFISVLNTKSPSFVFARMLRVQFMFFLPVILYALICIWIGITHQWYVNTVVIGLFILIVCLIGAWRYIRLIRKNGIVRSVPILKIGFPFSKGRYMRFVLQYIGTRRKMLFLAVKIFSCLLVFGMLLNHTKEESDLSMFLLFYSFGLMGHGVLIYKIRSMEEFSLGFYRGLPVSLSSRLIQYALLCLILLIPEIIIIVLMTPVHLDYANALMLIFFGWGILILLNSLLFIRLFKPFSYLKIVSGIYLMVFIAVLTGLTIPFTICLFLISVYLFSQGYYRFETADPGTTLR
jgi:hypothetical protein